MTAARPPEAGLDALPGKMGGAIPRDRRVEADNRGGAAPGRAKPFRQADARQGGNHLVHPAGELHQASAPVRQLIHRGQTDGGVILADLGVGGDELRFTGIVEPEIRPDLDFFPRRNVRAEHKAAFARRQELGGVQADAGDDAAGLNADEGRRGIMHHAAAGFGLKRRPAIQIDRRALWRDGGDRRDRIRPEAAEGGFRDFRRQLLAVRIDIKEVGGQARGHRGQRRGGERP